MNATPSVSQAQSGNDASQLSAPASDSAATGANSQDFAKALSDAGGKPIRKPATHRTTGMDSGGGQLPAAGNPSPPRSAPPQATAAPAAGAPAAGAPAAPNSPAAAPAGTLPTAQLNVGGSMSPPAAIAQPPGLQAATVDNASGPNIAGASGAATQVSGAPAQTPGVPASIDAALGIGGAAIPGIATPGVRAASSDSAAPATPALMDGTASLSRSAAPGAAAEPPSAPSSAAPAAGSPAADSSSPPGGVVMSDTGVKLLDAALANAGQTGPVSAGAVPAGVAPAPAMALPMPVAPAAAAAAAATNTQALLTRASAGAEDKRAPGSAAIPSLSLTPNDGGNGAAGAAQLLANPTASTAATPAPVLKVAAAVDSAEFGQGVATQVSLMVDRNLNGASLQVNPPALGPIEVRIALQGGHAQVWFTSHSPVTRDALESSSSKLREMLGTQGFAQVSVDISQRSFQERSAQSQSYQAMPAERSAAGSGASAQVRSAGSIPRAASGLLDAYA